jgi:hypothetical protein
VAADGAPPSDVLQAHVLALEALLEAGRTQESERRIAIIESRIDARMTPGAWGEFLRSRGEWHAQMMRASEAYHDLAQSSTVFELLGERYEAARSHLALGRLAARAGARPLAEGLPGAGRRHVRRARRAPDRRRVASARALLALPGTGAFIGSSADADDALVRRLVDAAALPELLRVRRWRRLIETTGGAGWRAVCPIGGTAGVGARRVGRRARGGAELAASGGSGEAPPSRRRCASTCTAAKMAARATP